MFLFNTAFAASEENKSDHPYSSGLKTVVQKTLGKDIKIIRMDAPEKSRIDGFKQIRVWFESAYGETPLLFYCTDDGNFYFGGSLYDAQGNNLTKLDVGETKPRTIQESDFELHNDYLIGNKDAVIHAVLWIGTDRFSKELFEAFYRLYENNKEKLALYIKFFPRSGPDAEKMKALTCFRNEALVHALRVIYDANPAWGTAEHLDAFKKTGDQSACNEELVLKDLKRAEILRLPAHPMAFINGVILLDTPTRENVMKLAGTELK